MHNLQGTSHWDVSSVTVPLQRGRPRVWAKLCQQPASKSDLAWILMLTTC
jgi:hypothetical protein